MQWGYSKLDTCVFCRLNLAMLSFYAHITINSSISMGLLAALERMLHVISPQKFCEKIVIKTYQDKKLGHKDDPRNESNTGVIILQYKLHNKNL